MMYFKCMIGFLLSEVTTLASQVVSFPGLTPATYPCRAVIRLIPSFPGIGIFANFVNGLPFPHALSVAKVMFVNVGIASAHFFTAIIAVNDKVCCGQPGAAGQHWSEAPVGGREGPW